MEMSRRNFMAAAGVAAAAAVAAPVIATADQAAPAEEAPAKDAGAVRICISVNNLERSRDFFCAAAAVAAPVIATADQAAPAEEAPAKDAGAVRICISVNNLERSRDFFCSQLEFTLVGEGILLEDVVEPLYGLPGQARYAMVKNDYQATVLQLIEFEARTGKCIRTEEDHGYDPGYFDVAVRCDDNYAVAKHLKKVGYTYYTEPYEYTAEWSGSTVSEAVLKGVDNVPTTMIMSISEPRPEFDGLFKNITDIALVISDVDRAEAFWTGVLDMPNVYDEELEDGVVDPILGLPEGTHSRMIYYSGVNTPVIEALKFSIDMPNVYDEELEDGVVDPILGLPEGTHSRMIYYSGVNTPVIEALKFSIEGTPMSETAKPENAGIFALGYPVDDLDATLQRAVDNGFEVITDPVENVIAVFGHVRSAMVSGPDGMLAEIFQKL